MLKKTKFFIGISLLVQSFTCMVIFIILLAKKKSLYKTFLAIALAGGFAGVFMTYKYLKEDKQFKAMMAAVDSLCDFEDEYDEDIEILVDDTASEEDFE